MKKISEMTLEELQDYAINLEQQQSALNEQLTEASNKNAELSDLNLQLQRRNNQLFLSVEQGIQPKQEANEPPAIESCEEFARKLIGVIK